MQYTLVVYQETIPIWLDYANSLTDVAWALDFRDTTSYTKALFENPKSLAEKLRVVIEKLEKEQ